MQKLMLRLLLKVVLKVAEDTVELKNDAKLTC